MIIKNARVLYRASIVFFILLVVVSIVLVQVVDAQSGAEYPEPISISHTSGLSTLPKLAADRSGRVHVIWAETTNLDENSPTDTGYYRTLVDGLWSDPVDVLAVPYGDSFNPYVLTVDPDGRLVFVWTQARGVNVSTVDATNAGQPQRWTTARLDAETPVNSADLVVDDTGIYHLTYVRNNRELIYTKSLAGIGTWSNPVTVTIIDRDEAISNPSIEVSEDGAVFVAWTRSAEAENWGPIGVDFTRSVDGGATWGAVQVVVNDGRYASPDLLLDQEQKLHIFWLGSGATGGRYHRWSDDGGVTWTDTIVVMRPEEITGFPGPPTLLLDSAGTVHVIFAGLGHGGERIWHSMWDGHSWRQPLPISGNLPDSQGPSAVINLEHQIHVAWVEYDSEDVWWTSFDTGAPPVDIGVLPRSELAVLTPATRIPVEPNEGDSTLTIEATVAPQLSFSTASPEASMPVGLTLALAIAPVILLIGGAIAYSFRRR